MRDKKQLRQILRNDRRIFERKNKFREDTSLPEAFARILRHAPVVAGYVKTGSEVDPAGLMSLAARFGKTTVLPWLAHRDAPLEFRVWKEGEPLEQAPFGYRQPSATAPLAAPNLILTPLVGFDRSLNRLGQGAGHYDKAFRSLPESLRVGLAWSVQETDELVPDRWDVPLDAVLTEKEWITAPHSRIGG